MKHTMYYKEEMRGGIYLPTAFTDYFREDEEIEFELRVESFGGKRSRVVRLFVISSEDQRERVVASFPCGKKLLNAVRSAINGE